MQPVPAEDEPAHDPTRRIEIPRFLVVGASIAWRVLVIAGAVYVAGLVVARLRIVVLPLLFALVLAAVLQPAVNWLKDRGLPALAATWVVVVIGLAVILGLLWFAVWSVSARAEEIGESLAQGWNRIAAAVGDLPFVSRQDIEDLSTRAGEQLVQNGAEWFLAGAATALEIVVMTLLTVVIVFFFVKDGPRLSGIFLRQFDPERRGHLEEMGSRAWSTLTRYMVGITLIATIVTVATGVVLVVVGTPLVLPVMVVTFIGSYIPFAGPWIAGVMATLVTLATVGMAEAAAVALAFIVIQQVDGNVLEPVILGRVMHLHPVAILAAVTAGALVAGLPGAFLAIPLLAVIVTTYTYGRQAG